MHVRIAICLMIITHTQHILLGVNTVGTTQQLLTLYLKILMSLCARWTTMTPRRRLLPGRYTGRVQ